MKSTLKTSTEIKEEKIRPDELFSKFIELSARDAETFFDPKKLVKVPCPACNNQDAVDGFDKFTFHYDRCAGCGTLYASPRPTRQELLRYYAESESQKFWGNTILKKTGEERKAAIMAPNITRIESVLENIKKAPRRILDIGAGNGAFLSEWKNKHPKAELIAIEPGKEQAKKCREMGITVFEGFVENECENPEARGDMVTCFEVLEHVQDPQTFAQALYKVTSPGGIAVITCLTGDGFDIQVLWKNSRSVMPPYHLNFLSRKGIETLFGNAGFNRVEMFTPGRLDVEIVQRSLQRGTEANLSRFEKLLLSRGEETLTAFQHFLAEHALSSHAWIVCQR